MKRVGVILIAVGMICTVLPGAFAADNDRNMGQDIVHAGKTGVNYTGNFIYENVQTVGKFLTGTAETVVEALRSSKRVFTERANPKEMFTKPAVIIGETATGAVVDVAETPQRAVDMTRAQE